MTFFPERSNTRYKGRYKPSILAQNDFAESVSRLFANCITAAQQVSRPGVNDFAAAGPFCP